MFAVYSSFLQRAYDQLIHDVALQNLPVVLAVDRAGLVGSDGETHQGIFDLSYLSSIPNMVVMTPKHKWELADMLRFALSYDGPVAIRYPRGSAFDAYRQFRAPVVYGKSEMLYEEKDIAILSVGHMFESALQARERLKESGYSCTLVNARFVKPIDEAIIASPITARFVEEKQTGYRMNMRDGRVWLCRMTMGNHRLIIIRRMTNYRS